MSYVLTPGEQGRGWELRWRTLQKSLADLVAPRKGGASAAAIEDAERDVFEFFSSAYHLKDALKAQGAIDGTQLENTISATPELALLANLANLDKHHQLSKPPRSGHIPTIGPRTGASVPGGWQVRTEITHDGARLDALVVAQSAMTAWERVLRAHGLL